MIVKISSFLSLKVSQINSVLIYVTDTILAWLLPLLLAFYLILKDLAHFIQTAGLSLVPLWIDQWSTWSHQGISAVRLQQAWLLPAVLAVVALPLLFRLFFLIGHFKAQALHIKAAWSRFVFGFKVLFTRDFYQRLFQRLDALFANLIYNLLALIWEWASTISFIRDNEEIKKVFSDFWTRIRQGIDPLVKWVRLRVKAVEKDLSSQVLFSLMDEARETDEASPVHQELQAIFKAYSSEILSIETVKNQVEECVGRWQKGLISGMLITGYHGNGKSSLLKSIHERFQDQHSVHYLFLQRGQDLWQDTLISSLRELSFEQLENHPPVMIILDNLELLFSQMPGGFTVIREFILLVERTKSKILWIVSAGGVFTQFYSRISSLQAVFPYFRDLSLLNSKDVARTVQANLDRSDYKFQYIPDKKLYKDLKSREKRKEASGQDFQALVREEFFSRLYSRGLNNLNFYHFYFLRSIRHATEKQVFIDMPQFLELQDIEELPQADLFILQAIFIHNVLSKEDLMQILSLNSDQASLSLSLLYEKNLIKKTSTGFTINPPLYPQLFQLLRRKNLLNFIDERRV